MITWVTSRSGEGSAAALLKHSSTMILCSRPKKLAIKESVLIFVTGMRVFRSLMDQEYARIITEHGGIGLSAMLEKQLIPPAQSSGESRSGVSHDKRNAIDRYGVEYENR